LQRPRERRTVSTLSTGDFILLHPDHKRELARAKRSRSILFCGVEQGVSRPAPALVSQTSGFISSGLRFPAMTRLNANSSIEYQPNFVRGCSQCRGRWRQPSGRDQWRYADVQQRRQRPHWSRVAQRSRRSTPFAHTGRLIVGRSGESGREIVLWHVLLLSLRR